ncbi:hypothetical protein MAR_024421, partial [Mya arenaria]
MKPVPVSDSRDSQFLWSLCNKTAVPVVVTSLHIEPDPIQFGHNISFSGQIDVFEDVGTTKTLEGNYPIPTLTKMVPNPPITVSGRFDITMTLTESQKEIGCLNVQLCLGSPAHLKVMMKLGTQWFDVCVYKPEYCNINDVCDWMKRVVSDKCPPHLEPLCQCPFKK